MKVAIHQPQYLPWLGFFDKMDRADVFVLLDDVQYKKNEWQNRNKIRNVEGWQWLTVPVLHEFGQKISEVKIDNEKNWKDKHLKSLELN
ncbi:MAG: WbqC family protein, partial [Candidatus Omnitrophota bacterium]